MRPDEVVDDVVDLLAPLRADLELLLVFGDLAFEVSQLGGAQLRGFAGDEPVDVGRAAVPEPFDHRQVPLRHVPRHGAELLLRRVLLVVALHADVDEVAALRAIVGRLIAMGAHDRSRTEGVQPHHHPAAELHLPVGEHAEHGLQLVVVEGVDVVEHDERAHLDRLAVPVDANPADCIEGRVGGRGVDRQVLELGSPQASADFVDRPLDGERSISDSNCGQAADLLEMGLVVGARDELDRVDRAGPVRREIADEPEHRAGLHQPEGELRLDDRLVGQLPELAIFRFHRHADGGDVWLSVLEEPGQRQRVGERAVGRVGLVLEDQLDHAEFGERGEHRLAAARCADDADGHLQTCRPCSGWWPGRWSAAPG